MRKVVRVEVEEIIHKAEYVPLVVLPFKKAILTEGAISNGARVVSRRSARIVPVTCSPKPGPAIMRVVRLERGGPDAPEPIHRGADRQHLAGARGRRQRRRALSASRRE